MSNPVRKTLVILKLSSENSQSLLIRKIDPEAFVVVTETLEVMGKSIGNQPHW
jgi:uncharacterized membrane-anchored protein YitT (DUF2179 family)